MDYVIANPTELKDEEKRIVISEVKTVEKTVSTGELLEMHSMNLWQIARLEQEIKQTKEECDRIVDTLTAIKASVTEVKVPTIPVKFEQVIVPIVKK